MEIEIEIISKEDIKPSSLTPKHLRDFKLSVLDQLICVPYAPIILFYHTSPNHNDTATSLSEVPKRLRLLKQSLSETLTQFYPLGGRIKDDLSIDCDDKGANFVEAKVKCPLSKFLSQPQLFLLQKFLPNVESNSGRIYVTNIQVNIFECGGIVIATCISHKVIDGAALSTFLIGWTSKARGCKSNQLPQPNFISSSLFPANSLWLRDLTMSVWGPLFRQGMWVTRRFLFQNSDIVTLKAQMSSTTNSSHVVKDPTRVEIVSAVLWKCFMVMSKARSGTQRPTFMSHLVNLRRKIEESHCPQHAMGNLLWLVGAEHMSDHEIGLGELVFKLKNAISKVDHGFVKELSGDKGKSIMQGCIEAFGKATSKNEVECFGISSWCNLGFYEADFGWGKPTWVTCVPSTGSLVMMNLTILADTKMKDGIEAWVSLDEQDMNHLIANSELLNYATLDPNPLAMNSVA